MPVPGGIVPQGDGQPAGAFERYPLVESEPAEEFLRRRAVSGFYCLAAYILNLIDIPSDGFALYQLASLYISASSGTV